MNEEKKIKQRIKDKKLELKEAEDELLKFKKTLPSSSEFQAYHEYHNSNVKMIEFGLKKVQKILKKLYIEDCLTKEKFQFKFTNDLLELLTENMISEIKSEKISNYKKIENTKSEAEFILTIDNFEKFGNVNNKK